MDDLELAAFTHLFRSAVQKCFGHQTGAAMSETESKVLSNRILEHTGLVIGWKTLKNYSRFVTTQSDGRPQNPSVSSLDTLARYVSDAPYTDETERKRNAAHYPFWFDYKNQFAATAVSRNAQDENKNTTGETPRALPSRKPLAFLLASAVVLVSLILYFRRPAAETFQTDFSNADLILQQGWKVRNVDTAYWTKRAVSGRHLTLFTLRGDSWPDTSFVAPVIKNLVYRRLPVQPRQTVTVYIDDFFPSSRWQQAGLILMKDTSLSAPTVRVSLAYNNEFGGYRQSPEIIVQVITAMGQPADKPEEIAHHLLLKTDSLESTPALRQMFRHSALRIERDREHFRILYAGGRAANTAFHEVVAKELPFQPNFVGLFALKGYVEDDVVAPVHFSAFDVH